MSATCNGDVDMATTEPVDQFPKIPPLSHGSDDGTRISKCTGKLRAANAEACFGRSLHFRVNALISSSDWPVFMASMPVKSKGCRKNLCGVRSLLRLKCSDRQDDGSIAKGAMWWQGQWQHIKKDRISGSRASHAHQPAAMPGL